MPLRKIKQTSKMLLIEEFCTSDNVPDLYTILRNEDIEQKSEFFDIIQKQLEVRSFEEFVEKFMPSVWEWVEATNDPNAPMSFCYSLEKPERVQNAHEVKLSKNEFYEMVMDLYAKKGMSDMANLEFDYSRIAELLAPKRVMENAKQLRKDLQYNYNKMLELGEGAKVEINECKKKIIKIRKDIISQYKDSFTGKLKLALADTESKLAALPDFSQEVNSIVTENENMKALPCRANFNSNGDIEMILIEDNQVQASTLIEEKDQYKLAKWIGGDYDKNGESEEFIRDLVVSNFCGGTSDVIQLDRDELLRKRETYTLMYKLSQEQFIRAISSAVEKILNAKIFFEQASISGRKLHAPIIVTNCKASKLVEESVKNKFEYYINECKREPDEYRIWFALIPAIGEPDLLDKVDIEIGDLDDIDINASCSDSTVKTQDGDVMVGVEYLKQILEILKDGKITTFFNFRANEITGFAKFNNDILETYKNKLDSIIGNPYAVFCYPNFTVLPKKETAIEIGKTGRDEYERKEYMDIPGIYVDSSYVAAGLVIASQNPELLAKKGYKVNQDNPCVRYDFEDGDNRFIMLTKMNREGKGAWASEVENSIGKDKFGFCFCGNTKFYNDERVKNTYVYVARNMYKDKSGIFEPLYTRLTMDFVMQYLQIQNTSIGGENTFNASTINKFIDETVAKWKRETEAERTGKNINNILKKSEDIIFQDDRLRMMFKETEEEFEIEIERSEKE